MSPNTYTLLQPVEILVPGRSRDPDEVVEPVKKTVTEIPLRPVSGKMYLDLGDPVILATSPGGGSYEIELDGKLADYLARRIDDPKVPEAAAARKALHMADALALRADTIDQIDNASNEAWAARQGADPESVKLLKPVEIHGEMLTAVPLKWPTGGMFERHGQIYFKSRLGDGSRQLVERTDVIAKYIALCLGESVDEMSLFSKIGLADMLQIKMAVTGFFTQAVDRVNVYRKSMASSSAPSSSPSPTPSA